MKQIFFPLLENMAPEFLYMHDNARPHSSATISEWFEDHNILLLEWPAQSPDLNPIEHLWDNLQMRVSEDIENIETKDQLFACLQYH